MQTASLTQNEAELRAASFSHEITYNIFLDLKLGQTYSGITQIDFNLINTNHVFLDYAGKSIKSVNLNGHGYQKEDIEVLFQNSRLILQGEKLSIGKNQVVIHFENNYSNDGNGLHSFIDTDEKQYIYTQTEPYHGNRIFPIFDQPDLKGKLNLKTACSEEWTVIAINPGKIRFFSEILDEQSDNQFLNRIQNFYQKSEISVNSKFFDFQETKPLSTYLYGFAAGPFKLIHLPIEKSVNSIPMAIYARDSLFQYAENQALTIFSFAVEGIKFYTKFFDFDYPFQKFDFVFCPEYTVGAMEYPGVITFNDRYLFREVPNIVQVSRRGSTILHELAHMWFGNLVTMKWWNDLWLNESFADFVCYLALNRIASKLSFEVEDGWSSFFQNKFWGYDEDQMQTTHPIFCEVLSTSKADSIFDGITYSKGAAILKQLFCLVGEQQFSENISNYFKKYQWRNTILDDFIAEMGRANIVDAESQLNLSVFEWKNSWIETAGLNTVEVQWNPKIKSDSLLTLKQAGVLKEHGTLRHHKLQLAFLDENAKLALIKEVILKDKPSTEIKFINKDYHAIIPNFGDWAYIRIKLDDHSLNFVTSHFDQIEDSLTKQLIVRSMYESVKDAQLKGDALVHLLLDKCFFESKITNISLFKSFFGTLSSIIWNYLPKPVKIQTRSLVFQKLEKMLPHQDTLELQKFILKEIITFAFLESEIDVIRNILENELEKSDSKIGINDKWRILAKIFSSKQIKEEQKQDYMQRMCKLDSSDAQKETKLLLSALTSGVEERLKLWTEYINKESKFSFEELEYSMRGFFSEFVDEDLKTPFFAKYFEVLPNVLNHNSKSHGSIFLSYSAPNIEEDKQVIEKLKVIENELPQSNEFFKIEVKKMIDDLQRQELVFALFA